ncbi:metallophosphoesterase family protein [Bryobacter aggregatus]|uniref:metallophosphoesterase family protein n=1 Tax=Bryobacter aggregatus TaxID=360054 RepID=UPI0004E10A8D|nr:metallophosphoesterase [Bryobacter aggregatus]
MNILFFSDIHTDWAALHRLLDLEADYYFCLGDLVSWRKHLNLAGEILQRRAGKTFVIPGNHESASDIEDLCNQYGLENLHGKTKNLGGVSIAGLGFSNPTPFHTPGEFTEEELEQQLARLRPSILWFSPAIALRKTRLSTLVPGAGTLVLPLSRALLSRFPRVIFCAVTSMRPPGSPRNWEAEEGRQVLTWASGAIFSI